MQRVHSKLLWLPDAKQEESAPLTGVMSPLTGVYSYRMEPACILCIVIKSAKPTRKRFSFSFGGGRELENEVRLLAAELQSLNE